MYVNQLPDAAPFLCSITIHVCQSLAWCSSFFVLHDFPNLVFLLCFPATKVLPVSAQTAVTDWSTECGAHVPRFTPRPRGNLKQPTYFQTANVSNPNCCTHKHTIQKISNSYFLSKLGFKKILWPLPSNLKFPPSYVNLLFAFETE